ncbi:MAG: GHMP kinase [Planctomycetia bacterium]|nr:GHMP kinase [Planctomycetia bacterium]
MIISKTPFRISFFGGGTDYPEHFTRAGGAVLGTAIDKFAYLSATRFYSRLFDYVIRLGYGRVECVTSLAEIQHAPFRECLRWVGITEDVEVDYTAELPSSTGLGTSSSFVVGVLNALYTFQGRVVHPLELAYQAVEIERAALGEAVGCQDQTFAALGGINVIEFRQLRDFVVHRIPLSAERQAEFQDHLLLVFTGIRRRASEVAASQVKKIGHNAALLCHMRRMVDEGYRIMTGNGSLAPFGKLLHDGWVVKNQLDHGVSNAVIDEIYKTGVEHGALGGKLLGAGGGGFMLFFVPPEQRASVRAALGHLEEIPVRINALGTQIIHTEAAPSVMVGSRTDGTFQAQRAA